MSQHEDETSHGQPRRLRGGSTLATGAVIVAFVGGMLVGTQGIPGVSAPAAAAESLFKDAPPANVDLSPVWRAWNVLDEKYVETKTSTSTEEVTDQDRVWGMISGLASSLNDPYTVFLPPSEAEIFQSDISGSFEGVGMEIAIREGALTVVSPLRGTPAARAGIQSGDKILTIDGESTRNMGINEAVERIRGERGTTVTFTISRDGEPGPLEIMVTRDVINIPTIETELRSDGIFVIELLSFTAVSPELFRDALRTFVTSGSDKLILDLRGNPGGYLSAAVDIASWFLPSGRVVVTEDYGENQSNTVHRSRGYDIFNDNLQMVILIDRGSASASEILAQALRNYDIAQLVGTPTFGKGSVQELVPITPETALKVTVARWVGPGGEAIPHEGIEPDIKVSMEDEDGELPTDDRDPQLERAVQLLLNGR